MLASLAGGRGPAGAVRAPPGSKREPRPVMPRNALGGLLASLGSSGPCVTAWIVGSRPGLPSPSATIACLPRFAPPTCIALHVEGFPSLRGAEGSRSVAARAHPRRSRGEHGWLALGASVTFQRGHDRLRALDAPAASEIRQGARSRAVRLARAERRHPSSACSPFAAGSRSDPRVCNTGVYKPAQIAH